MSALSPQIPHPSDGKPLQQSPLKRHSGTAATEDEVCMGATPQTDFESAACSLPPADEPKRASGAIFSQDDLNTQMTEFERSSSPAATCLSSSPSISNASSPPSIKDIPPPATAALVTASTIAWLSEDDMRCSLVRLGPPQECPALCEEVGLGRGIYIIYTQREGLVIAQDISARISPWRPYEGAPVLRPFCLFLPPRLDGKHGRKLLPTTVYTTQTSDLCVVSAETNTTPSTTPPSSSPSTSTVATAPCDKPSFCLPCPALSPNSSAALPSSPSSSHSVTSKYAFRPSAEVSKLTVCAFYTEELALLQLERRHIQTVSNLGGGSTAKQLASSRSASSWKVGISAEASDYGGPTAVKDFSKGGELTSVENEDSSNSNDDDTSVSMLESSEHPTRGDEGEDKPSPSLSVALMASAASPYPPNGDDLYSKFFFPPPISYPASFCVCPSSSFNHLLLEFNTDVAGGKSELLQLRPSATSRVIDEHNGLRSRLAKFKRMYKETFSGSFKAEAHDGGALQIRKRPTASTSRNAVSRAPANTLNSKDGNARGRVCSRYQVDADGRRVLRSGYELSGDYMKHQQQGKIFELRGVFGANVKQRSEKLAAAVTSEGKDADRTRVASSASDSNSLASTALPSRDGASSRSNERASLTDSATARATDQAAEDSTLAGLLLSGADELPNSAEKDEEQERKQKEAKNSSEEAGELCKSHGAFIPGDLFGNTGKKWAYVADDFDEDGIDEALNMPSVVAEECKLLAGKRASPLTGRCNLSLANLRSVSALQRTFSMSMYHYEGKRPIFLSCVQPVCQSDDEDDSTLATAADAANGNQIGDHLEVSGDRLNRDHKCKTAEAPRSNVMGNVLEDITEESRDDVEEVHNSSSVQNGRCDGTDKIPQIVGEPHPDPTGSPGEVPALGSRVTCGHSEPARAADSQTDIAPSACQRGEPVVVNEGDKSINDQAGIGRKDSDDEEDTAAENAEQEADAGILYWVPYGGNRFGERFVQMLHGHAYVHIGFLFVRLLRACLELQI
eukprot:GHVS01062565.1.p1 GENE.GHVS01062565.1~~GHVS01062565.1.p1  ORF type:complete len:1112 (+),score=174.80 GHVS01062565.1:273-3338(+)